MSKILVVYPGQMAKTRNRKLEDAIENLPEEYTIDYIFLNKCVVSSNDEGETVFYHNGKVLDIRGYDMCYIARPCKCYFREFMKLCLSEGVPTVPALIGSATSSNKFVSHMRFADANIPTPDTMIMGQIAPTSLGQEKIEGVIRDIAGDGPNYLLKPNKGSLGEGVDLMKNYESLTQYMNLSLAQAVLIQRYISPNKRQDERYIVGGDKVLNAELRVARGKNVITNLSGGGKGLPLTYDKETEELAVKAAHTVGLMYGGVDIIRDEEGHPYILEVNAYPGTKIIQVTGKNHFYDLLEYFSTIKKQER